MARHSIVFLKHFYRKRSLIVYKFRKFHILLTVSAKDLGGCHEGSPEIIPQAIQKEFEEDFI
jgi:hypothetical protein